MKIVGKLDWAAYKRRKKTLGRNFFLGRCVVGRQIKGKIFPFKTLFLLDASLIRFFSWELLENEKNAGKRIGMIQLFFISQAKTAESFRFVFRIYAPFLLSQCRGRAVFYYLSLSLFPACRL